jgi:hypothetical protein
VPIAILADRDHGFDFDTLLSARSAKVRSSRSGYFMTAIAGVAVEFMLWLENDWESTHPIPTLEQLRGFAEVDQWRLYGHRKNAAGGPRSRAGTKNLGDGSALEWRPSQSIKGWEFTPRAHWGAGGTIVRPEKLEPHRQPFLGRERMKDVIKDRQPGSPTGREQSSDNAARRRTS